MMTCFFCKTEYTGDKIFFRDTCPACGGDLHICHNCQFFDPHAHRQCRESAGEPVRDKDRANFCEYFKPGNHQKAAGRPDQGSALQQLEALFKK